LMNCGNGEAIFSFSKLIACSCYQSVSKGQRRLTTGFMHMTFLLFILQLVPIEIMLFRLNFWIDSMVVFLRFEGLVFFKYS
jgi:hypothetical protein